MSSGFVDGVKGLAIGAAMMGNVATSAPGLVQATDLSEPVKDSLSSLMTEMNEAIESGVQGAAEGEDAAGSGPVDEPESSEHRDPEAPREVDEAWAVNPDLAWAEPTESEDSDASETAETEASETDTTESDAADAADQGESSIG